MNKIENTKNQNGESENERVVCEQARDKCIGKIEVYKYIGTILILIILVYVGLKLSPIKALIPILLFVPILFLISCMIHPKNMEKKSLNYMEYPLNTFEIASMLYNVDIGLLKGIAYGETGHLKEKKRIKAISSSGALGYMQILPSTAGDACPKAKLFHKEDNIYCATKYLSWIAKHYCKTKDPYCLTMSYRHGPNAFKKGIKKIDWKYWNKVKKYIGKSNKETTL